MGHERLAIKVSGCFLIAFVLNLHCLRLGTRTQHSGWNKIAIGSPIEERLTGSVHGNIHNKEWKRWYESKYDLPNTANHTVHMKCCPAHLNSCPASTRTLKNPIMWYKKIV